MNRSTELNDLLPEGLLTVRDRGEDQAIYVLNLAAVDDLDRLKETLFQALGVYTYTGDETMADLVWLMIETVDAARPPQNDVRVRNHKVQTGVYLTRDEWRCATDVIRSYLNRTDLNLPDSRVNALLYRIEQQLGRGDL